MIYRKLRDATVEQKMFDLTEDWLECHIYHSHIALWTIVIIEKRLRELSIEELQHLSLYTDSFINALRRVLSRRGLLRLWFI